LLLIIYLFIYLFIHSFICLFIYYYYIVCQEHLLKTVGRHVDDRDVTRVAIDSVLQQYHNEVSTLMDQLRGARERQTRVLLEKFDDTKRIHERLVL